MSSTHNTSTMDDGSVAYELNEKGALGYALDPWLHFLEQVFPDTSAEEVADAFRPLYKEDPKLAFKYAMLFGNLRKGGGGKCNMNAFVACMDVIWATDPMHIVANVENIMDVSPSSHLSLLLPKTFLTKMCKTQDVSCKMMLVLLKHFSNPDPKHLNNYWGNLAAIAARKQLRCSFSKSAAVEDTDSFHDYRDIATVSKARRKKRFEGHQHTLEAFLSSSHFQDCYYIQEEGIFSILQPKVWVRQPKAVTCKVNKLMPRSSAVAEQWEAFQHKHELIEQLRVEYDRPALVYSETRSAKRYHAWRQDQGLPAVEQSERDLVYLFSKHHAQDEALHLSVAAAQSARKVEVIQHLKDFGEASDDISEASTDEDEDKAFSVDIGDVHEFTFFDFKEVEVEVRAKRFAGTRESMNPLSGFEVIPELQSAWMAFVHDRDAKLAAEAKLQTKSTILQERSSEERQSGTAVAKLFDAVLQAFVKFMDGASPMKRRLFAFKYCPTPGCSADKGTGNLETGGIGEALLRHLASSKSFSVLSATQGRREFKEYVACYREALGRVPESCIGRRQIRQIDLSRAPTLHLRLFSDRIHKRHNVANYTAFQDRVMANLREVRIFFSLDYPSENSLTNNVTTGQEGSQYKPPHAPRASQGD